MYVVSMCVCLKQPPLPCTTIITFPTRMDCQPQLWNTVVQDYKTRVNDTAHLHDKLQGMI